MSNLFGGAGNTTPLAINLFNLKILQLWTQD